MHSGDIVKLGCFLMMEAQTEACGESRNVPGTQAANFLLASNSSQYTKNGSF
jgi:hypothetical protein